MSNHPSPAGRHETGSNTGHGDIHRADPGFRQRMLILLAICVAAGGVVIALLPGWLASLRDSHAGSDPAELEQLLRMGFTALALLMIAPMLLLARQALGWSQRIITADSFPTADMKTIRDVAVLHGEAAQRVARLHRLAGNLLVWLSVAVMAWVAWIWLR